MLCSFVQFGPERFDLPCVDCGLQGAVEAAVVQRIQLQLSAEDAEGLESPFASGSLHEVLEEHAGLAQVLVLPLAHLAGWQAVDLRSGLLAAPERRYAQQQQRAALQPILTEATKQEQIVTALLVSQAEFIEQARLNDEVAPLKYLQLIQTAINIVASLT